MRCQFKCKPNNALSSMWKEVFCTFFHVWHHGVLNNHVPYSYQFFCFCFQFMHSTCSEIWGLSTPNTIDQWDTAGLYSFCEQTRWIFCPLSHHRNLVGGIRFGGSVMGWFSCKIRQKCFLGPLMVQHFKILACQYRNPSVLSWCFDQWNSNSAVFGFKPVLLKEWEDLLNASSNVIWYLY